MHEADEMIAPDRSRDEQLAAALTRADLALCSSVPIVKHLIDGTDSSLFSDAIIARVTGMAANVAYQLAGGIHDETMTGIENAATKAFFTLLVGDDAFIAHCHALACEYSVIERLRAVQSIDPVLTPMLQAVIASDDATLSGEAMAVLSAQARFMRHLERMELPLSELPGDIFDTIIGLSCGVAPQDGEVNRDRETAMRANYDEAAGRIAKLDRLVNRLGKSAMAALAIDHAGVALFLSSLACLSHQPRDMFAMSMDTDQIVRLAIAMRAVGLDADKLASQLELIAPDLQTTDMIARMGPDRARELLATMFVSKSGGR